MTPKLHTTNRRPPEGAGPAAVAPARAALLTLALGLAAPAADAVMPAQPLPTYREGEVLVRYHASAGDAPARALKSSHGLQSRDVLLGGRLELLRLPAITTTAAALEVLRRDPAVAYAEPNFLRYPRATIPCPDDAGLFCPDDTYFGDQWGLRSTGQANFAVPSDPAFASIPGADMDLLLAWDPGADGVFERVGEGVTIAIVDDGFALGHPDLAANFVAGYDFVDSDNDPSSNNEFEQHGTLVAGAAGAVGNNGVGVAGTAWKAKLMPLKYAFDIGSQVAVLAFARDNGAKIVNASFGGPTYSQAEEEAILDLHANGILYVASAGNDDSNTDFAQLHYPSNLNVPNIVSVAATNRQDRIASFSQYGAITTDVAAPGLQIVTTTLGDGYSAPLNCPLGGSCGVTGTSFSAPYTAGVAALIREAYPAATPVEVKARLIEGAEPGNDVRLRNAGGRVNAANALDIAPRPALVINKVEWLDTNQALDPGETLDVGITLENLWLQATAVSGTLTADNGVTVNSGAVDFGTIDGGATSTMSFSLTVAGGITEHRYVHFTLALSANGGAYTTTRGFIAEIGRLQTDVLVTQDFVPRDVDLYDEFHAWHYDFDGVLPEGHNQLVIETTSASAEVSRPDIDLLVKRDEPPRYAITVGLPPGVPGTFCTGNDPDALCRDPSTLVSAGADGDERVVISNPMAGTYHIVIVNFAHLPNGLTYTVRAYTRPTPAFRGTGGGRLPLPTLALLGLAVLARRLRAA